MTDMPSPDLLREVIRSTHLAPEGVLLDRLVAAHGPDAATRARATARGEALVERIRGAGRPGLMGCSSPSTG
jgi:hypothetical protein